MSEVSDVQMDIDDLLTKAVHHIPRRLMEHWLNKVHCDDCLKVMNKIPTGSVDLIVTSPPYNLRNSTGGGLRNGSGGKWESAALLNGYAESDDAMPYKEYVKWQRECLTAMMRLLPEDGAIFYNHKWRVQGGLLQDRSDIVKDFPCPANHHLATGRRNQFQRRLFPPHLRSDLSYLQA